MIDDLSQALDSQSEALTRELIHSDPFINEMLKINDIAWQARSRAADRPALYRHRLVEAGPSGWWEWRGWSGSVARSTRCGR